MPARETAAQFVRELIEAEAAAQFPRLRRVPSSTVRHFVDYYGQLSPRAAETMRAALAARGALALQPMPRFALPAELAAVYERWTNARASAGFERGGRYQPLRLAKNIVGAGLAAEANVDPQTAQQLAEIKAATATQLRRLMKPILGDRLGLAGRNERGGNWTYDRNDGSLKVRIDFGGRSDQLRYSVSAVDLPSGGRIAMATYEALLGLFGGWDWIVEDAAADAVDLLAELVAAIEPLARELYAVR